MGRGATLLVGCLAALLLAACGPAAPEGVEDLAQDVSGGDAPESESLYVAANLAPALANLRERAGGDAKVDIKIEQKSLKAQAEPAAGDALSVVIGASGNAFTVPIPGFPVEGPLVSEIDPSAVERIARQVASQAGVPLTGIDYFTTLTGSQPFTWGVYLEDGRRWEAGLDGSGVTRAN